MIVERALLNETSVVIGASETNTVVSENVMIRDGKHLLVEVTAASGTYVTGITLKVQDSVDGTNWNDSKTAAISADGQVAIKIAPTTDDAAHLPIRPLVRVVVSSGVGDAVTISKVFICHGD